MNEEDVWTYDILEDEQENQTANTAPRLCTMKRLFGCFVCVGLAFVVLRMDWFENLADLKFFFAIAFPFNVWTSIFPAEDSYREMSCADMAEIVAEGSRIPILFKQCLEASWDVTDFMYFPEEHQ